MAITETMDQVSQQAEKLQSLSSTQLNWKPSENEWSIGQCLDHLIVSNTTYFPTFEKVLHGNYRLGFLQKINPFKKALGPMMVRSLGPEPAKKFKAPDIFQPSSGNARDTIVQDFIQHQQTLRSWFEKLSQLNTSSIVIASPVSSFITYALADAMQIIVNHEQRHINQAMRVFNQPNFPES